MTTNSVSTTDTEFFDAKYRKDSDPWGFASSPDELRRYDAIVTALGEGRYRRAFEPGCSVGVLTERLAAICDHVEAVDLSPTAVELAKLRCSRLGNVSLRCGSLTEGLPAGGFDLLILSEIGYYFPPEIWRDLASSLIQAATPGCAVLAAHWLGYSADHCMSGDEVHLILSENSQLRMQQSERHETFRLERWERI